METSYTPVDWVYREVAEEQITGGISHKIFYFKDGQVEDVSGRACALEENKEGLYIRMDNDERIRMDRIITINGKPGAAYDEYDAHANSCMDCNGGYSQEEIDEFNAQNDRPTTG